MSFDQSARLFVRPLPQDIRVADVEDLFRKCGEVTDVRVMRGYGFVEFKSPADADAAVKDLNGREFEGSPLVVEFSRPRRERDDRAPREPREPRLRATHRVNVSGLGSGVGWMELKDFVRSAGVEVPYTDVPRDRDGSGIVDFCSKEDMDKAIEILGEKELDGATPKFDEDPRGPVPPPRREPRFGGRGGGRFGDRGGFSGRGGGRFGGRDDRRDDRRDSYRRDDRYSRDDRDSYRSRDDRDSYRRDDRDNYRRDDRDSYRSRDDRPPRDDLPPREDRPARDDRAPRDDRRDDRRENYRARSRSPPRAPAPRDDVEPTW